MIVKRRHEHYAVCDGCAEELEPEYEYLDVVAAMKREKWTFVRQNGMTSEGFHFCPACQARRERRD